VRDVVRGVVVEDPVVARPVVREGVLHPLRDAQDLLAVLRRDVVGQVAVVHEDHEPDREETEARGIEPADRLQERALLDLEKARGEARVRVPDRVGVPLDVEERVALPLLEPALPVAQPAVDEHGRGASRTAGR